MGIELTQLNHNYLSIEDETYEQNTCVIDTSTIKGKILCGLTYVVSAIILIGAVVGLAIFFAIL
jgi:hypothetical protein